MGISAHLTRFLCNLSKGNYDRTFSAYRFWIEVGPAFEAISKDQLYNDILSNTKPELITIPTSPMDGRLIHTTVSLLLRFITDAESDLTLSTYAIGLHDRLCRESLEQFFKQSLDCPAWGSNTMQIYEFYTRVNLIAHWVNLGYVQLEDVRDRILQSLTLQPTVLPHQLNSLMILLQISGPAFAAYMDPTVLDRCYDLLKPTNLTSKPVTAYLAQVRAPILTVKVKL